MDRAGMADEKKEDRVKENREGRVKAQRREYM
jgi:hypothetical protein